MQIEVDYLSNRLTIQGDAVGVAEARALLVSVGTAAAPAIGFGKAVPLDGDGSYEEEAVRAWGCHGDPLVPVVVEDAPDRFSVTFDTALSAPAPVVEAISRQVPGISATLECVWIGDTQGVSALGRWEGGKGSLEQVEGTRDHYLRVRPDTEDWELDELFQDPSPTV